MKIDCPKSMNINIIIILLNIVTKAMYEQSK